jgi:hypothetical protein
MAPVVEFLFGALAFLALLGWGLTNAITARNHLREATALETIMKVRKIMDDDALSVLNRYRELMAAKGIKPDGSGKTVLTDEEEARREAMRQGLNKIGDQPLSQDEVDNQLVTEMPIAE